MTCQCKAPPRAIRVAPKKELTSVACYGSRKIKSLVSFESIKLLRRSAIRLAGAVFQK